MFRDSKKCPGKLHDWGNPRAASYNNTPRHKASIRNNCPSLQSREKWTTQKQQCVLICVLIHSPVLLGYRLNLFTTASLLRALTKTVLTLNGSNARTMHIVRPSIGCVQFSLSHISRLNSYYKTDPSVYNLLRYFRASYCLYLSGALLGIATRQGFRKPPILLSPLRPSRSQAWNKEMCNLGRLRWCNPKVKEIFIRAETKDKQGVCYCSAK